MKKLFCILLISLFLICNYSFAYSNQTNETMTVEHTFGGKSDDNLQIHVTIDDPEAAEHFYKAEKASNLKEKLKEYDLAGRTLYSKKNITENDKIAFSTIGMVVGTIYYNVNQKEKAMGICSGAYSYLKQNNLNKNSKLAFGCLSMIFYISKEINNNEYYDYAADEMEQNLIGLAEQEPKIYELLYSYYEENNNTEKAQYYFSKCKKDNFAIYYDNFGETLSIPVTDKNVIDTVIKANITNSPSEQTRFALEAIKYYKSKKNPDKNDILAMVSMIMTVGDNSKNLADFKTAMSSYTSAYETLKKHNIHKNSPLSLYCLSNLYYFADALQDKKLLKYSATEMEKTQLKLAKKVPDIYEQLADYYYEIGNELKAKSYENRYLKEKNNVNSKK